MIFQPHICNEDLINKFWRRYWLPHCKNLVDWLWSRGNLLQQSSKKNRGGEGEGAGLGLHNPLDFLATFEERFSTRLVTSNFGNSTVLATTLGVVLVLEHVGHDPKLAVFQSDFLCHASLQVDFLELLTPFSKD